MTDAELEQVIKQAENKVGNLSARERAVAWATAEAALDIFCQRTIRSIMVLDNVGVCYRYGFSQNADRIAALKAVMGRTPAA